MCWIQPRHCNAKLSSLHAGGNDRSTETIAPSSLPVITGAVSPNNILQSCLHVFIAQIIGVVVPYERINVDFAFIPVFQVNSGFGKATPAP
ncbi:hypothetical protein TNCV_2616151 [Trichonephila clavipes]|nr:hypothetical protein TNCV_2616151 [Trichonephila clavipes]